MKENIVIDVEIEGLPVVYEEETNQWTMKFLGKDYSFPSLRSTRNLINSTPPKYWRQTKERLTALVVRQGLNGINVGDRCEIVAKRRLGYRVRGLGDHVIFSDDDLVADTIENEDRLKEWRLAAKIAEELPKIWIFGKTLTQVNMREL